MEGFARTGRYSASVGRDGAMAPIHLKLSSTVSTNMKRMKERRLDIIAGLVDEMR